MSSKSRSIKTRNVKTEGTGGGSEADLQVLLAGSRKEVDPGGTIGGQKLEEKLRILWTSKSGT